MKNFVFKTKDFVSKSRKNEELCNRTEELCIQNAELFFFLQVLDNPRGFFKDDAYAAAQLKELAKSDQSTNAIDASTYASERRFSRILFAQHRV